MSVTLISNVPISITAILIVQNIFMPISSALISIAPISILPILILIISIAQMLIAANIDQAKQSYRY